MERQRRGDRVWTFPNALSALRLLGVPVFLWLVLGPEADVLALLGLVVSGVTDWLDDHDTPYTTWDGWYRLDGEERRLGENDALLPRERKKIVEWEDMVAHARAVPQVP